MIQTQLKPLTKRQQQIFDYILECVSNKGAPPTRVEIAENFGFKSANAAEDHLKALDKKGHIELRSGTSRGIVISENARLLAQHEAYTSPELGTPVLLAQNMAQDMADNILDSINSLALIGDVAAGAPILANQHIQQYVNVDQSLFADNADFLLKVRGDSMMDVGIFEHDLLAIKKTNRANHNQIVVARIGDDVTVKRYQRNGNQVTLLAENDDYLPIEINLQTDSFTIEGIVVGLIRRDF